MSETEVFDLLSANEQIQHKFCVQEIKSVFRSQANQLMLRQFNDDFKKDDQGKSCEWRDIEEAEIMRKFSDVKQKLLKLFDEFKQVNLPKNLTVLEVPEQ